jgi:ubiquinone biosynthesis protein UbiJ
MTGAAPQKLEFDAAELLTDLVGLVREEETAEMLEIWGEKVSMSLSAAGKLRNVLAPVLEEKDSAGTFENELKRVCENVGCFGEHKDSKVKALGARVLELETKNVCLALMDRKIC